MHTFDTCRSGIRYIVRSSIRRYVPSSFDVSATADLQMVVFMALRLYAIWANRARIAFIVLIIGLILPGANIVKRSLIMASFTADIRATYSIITRLSA